MDPYSVDEIAVGIKVSVQDDGLDEARIAYSKTFSWKDNAVRMREVYLEAILEKSKIS